jgi:hypothetical protein
MWIFGLEMYHLATLLQLKGSLGATLKIPNWVRGRLFSTHFLRVANLPFSSKFYKKNPRNSPLTKFLAIPVSRSENFEEFFLLQKQHLNAWILIVKQQLLQIKRRKFRNKVGEIWISVKCNIFGKEKK